MQPEVVDDETVDRLLQASPVFGGLESQARADLRKELELRISRRGDVLMRQGDAADGLYLVGSGRLQVLLTTADGNEVVLNEVGRGELVGEMALLTDKPRSATIVALRDSHVLFLSTEAFSRVVQAHPQALRVISSALIDKLMNTIRQGSTTTPATSIAVLPLDDSAHAREFGARLGRSLEPLVGTVSVVTAEAARAELGANPSHLARAVWREHLEATFGAVVYVAEPTFGPWTDECVQQADLVVLVASARSPRGIRPVEHELHRRQGSAAHRMELVLLHEPSTSTPRGTRSWLSERSVDRHHHIRVDRDADYDRVARLLVGQGIGVVFGGGGARGIAHIGALRALQARGIAIDATAGASIGAIIAGAVARGDTPDDVSAQIHAAVVDRSPVDLTLPTVSFASGARVTQHIKDGAQGIDVEDTWLNFLCVSTNLTRGALEIHDRGPAWAAVRSSFSVPGLFPPMSNPAGDVLVDGGILDNLPVTPLRAKHAGITVIAFDVGARRDFLSGTVPTEGVVSGWRFLATTLRSRALGSLTSLPRLLMRLTELSSLGDADLGDCYVRPALQGVSLLDFDKFQDLVEMGERDSAPALDKWLAERNALDLT
jgi:predicted acylesterase/phospholipase RssA/CRP-like cAMP-binding protein